MKKIFLGVVSLLVFFLSACTDKEEDTPSEEVLNQPLKLKIDEGFDLYSPSTGNEITGVNGNNGSGAPGFGDLLYELSVYSSREGGGFNKSPSYFYMYDEIINNNSLYLNLESDLEHFFRLDAYYILSEDEISSAIAAGLTTEELDVTNSTREDAEVDTTVTILERLQQMPSFSFGTHHLKQIFAMTSGHFIPNPEDTVQFLINHETTSGPRIFDINIDNSNNPSLPGSIVLEIDGGNTDPISFDIDSIPDGLFITYDWLSRLELFYVSPTEVRASIGKKETGLGGYQRVFYTLNVTVPEVITDENGEFVFPVGSNVSWEIIFSGELYRNDTIDFGRVNPSFDSNR